MTLVLNTEEVVQALANARRMGLRTEIPTDWFLQKEHT